MIGDELRFNENPGYILLKIYFLATKEPSLAIWPRPDPLKVKEGKRLWIDCTAEDLSSKLKWYKRTKGTGKELDSSLVTRTDTVSKGINYGTMSVRFTNVTKSDSGTYVCKKHGSRPGEKVLEKSVHLVVLGEFKKSLPKICCYVTLDRPQTSNSMCRRICI